MCAINGFNFNNKELILKMNQATSHRGPDDGGVFADDGISLGHNRLSIIDLSPLGHQPMFSEDKNLAIVFNGEIYNFKELKNDFRGRGHKFISRSDTEVILKSFKEWGAGCVKKFNGIFAFAVWDKNKKELFLARDHIGVKPLYYYCKNNKFIFSSEIKAILEHGISRELDFGALNYYLRMSYVPHPFTIFKEIKKLPAGHFLRFKNGGIEIKKYWDIPEKENFNSREEARARIKQLLEDSVRHQIISDRPVGVFLSGGVDSSVVLGLARKIAFNIAKTYTTGFKDISAENQKKFNTDFELARQTAKHYGTEHRELMIGVEDVCENLEKIFWHLDEPNGNQTSPAMFMLAKEAKKDVAVVLGGDGGDELFGGYPRYIVSRLISRYQKLPVFIQKIVNLSLKTAGRSKHLSKLSTYDVHRIVGFMAEKEELVSSVLKPEIFQPALPYGYFEDILKKYPENYLKEDFEKIFMDIDRLTWLADDSLARTDKMTMAHGLEARVPILDYRLAEISQKIPTSWKMRGKTGKVIFRESFPEYILPHFANQPKTGWFTPMAKWLRREPLKSLAKEVLGSLPGEYFKKEEIEKIFEEHLTGKVYNLNIIWSLVSFGAWYNLFIKPK